MALQKEYEYKGMSCNYWRINLFSYDDTTDVAVVHLWLYANKTASEEDIKGNALMRKIVTLQGIKAMVVPDEIKILNLGPRDELKTLLYTLLKQSNIGIDEETQIERELNWFVDATDV